MSLLYLIDGCNVVNHKFFLQKKKRGLGDSRYMLLDLIRNESLIGSPKNRAIVVFDGYPSRGQDRQDDNISTIKAVFSFDESADDRIRKLLRQSANPKNVAVVSDDKQIMLFARLHNAKTVSVDEFLRISIESVRQKAARSTGEDSKLNYAQADKINRELKKIWLSSE